MYWTQSDKKSDYCVSLLFRDLVIQLVDSSHATTFSQSNYSILTQSSCTDMIFLKIGSLLIPCVRFKIRNPVILKSSFESLKICALILSLVLYTSNQPQLSSFAYPTVAACSPDSAPMPVFYWISEWNRPQKSQTSAQGFTEIADVFASWTH